MIINNHICKGLLIALIHLLLLTPCHATTYKWTDGKGVMHFSDAPPKKRDFSNLEEFPDSGISLETGTLNIVPAKKDAPKPPLNIILFEHADPHDMSEYRITKVTLMKEIKNSLYFDIEYINPEFIYPKKITESMSIFISANEKHFNSTARGFLKKGKGKIRVAMKLLSYAPEYVETTELRAMIGYIIRREGRESIVPLHKLTLPFKAKWQNQMN